MKAIVHARAVLPGRILEDAVILHENGVIRRISTTNEVDVKGMEILDAGGLVVGPGFVDIHCHAGGDVWAHQDPVAMALHHLRGGTTSLVCTLYHDIPHEKILRAAEDIRLAMQAGTPGNIIGIHMEGPYLSQKYGAHAQSARQPDPQEYRQYLEAFGDMIWQWTYSPELAGAEQFAWEVKEAGIVLAIGHSGATVDVVFRAVDNGAAICTHITNATGTSGVAKHPGAKAISFDQAVMLRDEVFCELINDSRGAHVPPLLGQLVVKTVGIDRMVGITDAGAGGNMGSDVNIVNEELYGSRLKMDGVARNFYQNTGLTVFEIFKVCAENPAKAIGYKEAGSITVGKRADFVLMDEQIKLQAVVLKGETAHDC